MRREEKNSIFSKRNIVALFIVFLMVFGFGGLVVDNIAKEKYEYNNFKFKFQNNVWSTEINNIKFTFDYFPTEIENIDLSADLTNKISNTLQIDSTYDLSDSYTEAISLAQFNLGQSLAVLNIHLRTGLTQTNEYALPIITCSDATEQIPIIYFKESDQTKVYLENNCIIAEAATEIDFIRIKDRLLYSILKIM